MNSNDEARYLVDRLREAMRSNDTDTPLGQAVARLKQPFVLGDGKKWFYEGFVSIASAVRQALAAIDPTTSPDLPPFLLDPATYAWFFRIPLENFNWQGVAGESIVLQKLAAVEAKINDQLPRHRQGFVHPDYLTIKQAAQLTCLSDSHIRRAIRAGELPASNVGSPLRPTWRIARLEVAAWMERQKGGTAIPPRSELQALINRHLPGLS